MPNNYEKIDELRKWFLEQGYFSSKATENIFNDPKNGWRAVFIDNYYALFEFPKLGLAACMMNFSLKTYSVEMPEDWDYTQFDLDKFIADFKIAVLKTSKKLGDENGD